MKPIPDCVPDILQMILDAAHAVSDDDFIHRKVLVKAMAAMVEKGDLESSPVDLAFESWDVACRALGVKDPFDKDKARNNKIALGIEKKLQIRLAETGHSLEEALNVSYAGAMAGFDVLDRTQAEKEVFRHLADPPARDDRPELVAALNKGTKVMLVADRAGEIVFDRVLADTLTEKGKQVWFAVASKPVYSMATGKDAVAALPKSGTTIVDPGTAMLGLAVEKASTEFQELFSSMDVVIAKGEINFETLSATARRDMFFILKAGCPHMAALLGISQGSGAIMRWRPSGDTVIKSDDD